MRSSGQSTAGGATGVSGAGPSPSSADAEAAFWVVEAHLVGLDTRRAVRAIERFRNRLEAIEASKLAGGVVGNGDATNARRAANSTDMSAREKNKRVKRGKAVANNPELAEKVASGEMTAEQLDAVANADARSNGAAANDSALVDAITDAPVDQAKGIVDDWIADRTSQADADKEHQRQRALRGARRGRTAAGLDSITLFGDKPSIDAAWDNITAYADKLYRQDGGRDVPVEQHPRTSTQRHYDAAIALITEPDSTTSASSQRPRVVIVVDAETVTDPTNPKRRPAEQAGVGPIADSVLSRHWCNAELIGAVYGTDPDPLWWGRSIRTATAAQFTALVARDKHCVLCGADHRRCEAHHLTPYAAPAKGRTDIDQLALLCAPCHRELHENQRTLIRGPDPGTWTTRPATQTETPPPRPQRE